MSFKLQTVSSHFENNKTKNKETDINEDSSGIDNDEENIKLENNSDEETNQQLRLITSLLLRPFYSIEHKPNLLMAFSNLFRRTDPVSYSFSYTCVDENSTIETLLDELESQCRHCCFRTSVSGDHTNNLSLVKRNSEQIGINTNYSTKRHASVDYSWLSPTNFLQPNDMYHLPDIMKMELTESLKNVPCEDCSILITNFRRALRHLPSSKVTPESIIAIFRKTIAEYLETKQKQSQQSSQQNILSKECPKSTISNMIRNNRILPKNKDDELCAELTEISITSSSTDDKAFCSNKCAISIQRLFCEKADGLEKQT
ncbi:unnamed protein product [Didymodactylos carnosus]|uniref:Uncharacterized protein n=2 Tax=Didymodactylos carnosus TaxID=1234261 RepID=A0A814CIF1_9BILA|nr:unnamed protein product [Didymodactylos carnosus]CAF3717205.1 unnamed protein product [Didymodactylos carnosus]